MTRWFLPDQVFDGESLRAGLAIGVMDRRIASIGTPPAGATVLRVAGTVTPGYVDLQVNGGGDVLLNHAPSPQAMTTMVMAHRRFGTVAILPTVITDAPQVMARAAAAALAAKGLPGVIGLHIEGPHISAQRRGTHAERFIRPLDDSTMEIVGRLRDAGVPVMITLAPEAASPAQIGTLAAMGAVVSLGHSDATAAETRAGLAAGATCFTHLFNAMSPMLNRAAGVVGAAINSQAHVGIICDGIHVADEMVGLAIRARPVSDRMFLVSDAMSTVGGSDHFRLYGQDIWLRDGKLVNDEGSLAGAHITMGQSVARLVAKVGIAPQTALRMAVTVPAMLMGRPDLAVLVGRDLADVLLLDAAYSFASDLGTHLADPQRLQSAQA